MAEADDAKIDKNFHLDIPARSEPFFLKGCNHQSLNELRGRRAILFGCLFGSDISPRECDQSQKTTIS